MSKTAILSAICTVLVLATGGVAETDITGQSCEVQGDPGATESVTWNRGQAQIEGIGSGTSALTLDLTSSYVTQSEGQMPIGSAMVLSDGSTISSIDSSSSVFVVTTPQSAAQNKMNCI